MGLNLSETFPGAESSGEQTADAAISTVAGFLTGVTLISDNTNDVTLIIYDNPVGASGKKLFEMVLDVSVEGMGKRINFPIPVRYEGGLYADISGTAASYIVEYTNR